VNEEALAHWGLSRQKERKKNKQANYWVLISVSMDRQQANILQNNLKIVKKSILCDPTSIP